MELSDTAKMMKMLLQDPYTLEECSKFANQWYRPPESATQLIQEFCLESDQMANFAEVEKLWPINSETGFFEMKGPIHWDQIRAMLQVGD